MMINIKSSFSTKLIVDILAIKFSTKSLPNDLPGVEATNILQEKFGIVSTEVALVKSDMPENQMTEILNKIEIPYWLILAIIL